MEAAQFGEVHFPFEVSKNPYHALNLCFYQQRRRQMSMAEEREERDAVDHMVGLDPTLCRERPPSSRPQESSALSSGMERKGSASKTVKPTHEPSTEPGLFIGLTGRATARLKTTDSGVFLAFDINREEDMPSPEKWEKLAGGWEAFAAMGLLPGVEMSDCSILPMRPDPKWGDDVGPHFSVVSWKGISTADLDGRPDVESEELRTKAKDLSGDEWDLDMSSSRIAFLLGVEANDGATNGPVMVVAAHEAVRPVLDDIRAKLGLKPFPESHSVHTTLCKVTGKDGNHEAFRKQLAGWPKPLGERFPKQLGSLVDAFGGRGKPPQLGEKMKAKLPDACTLEVINTTLRVASKIATKGVGEQVKAKGFLLIIGDRAQLEGGDLGKAPPQELNRFAGNKITMDMVDTDGEVQRYVYPAFTTDGAMTIDGQTGEILASNYTVTKNLENGSTAGGKKHAAASAIAQNGPCFVIKCSEDSCSVDGHPHGDFGIFNGNKESEKPAVRVRGNVDFELSDVAGCRSVFRQVPTACASGYDLCSPLSCSCAVRTITATGGRWIIKSRGHQTQ